MSEPNPIDAIRSNASLVRSVAREQLGQEFAFGELKPTILPSSHDHLRPAPATMRGPVRFLNRMG